MSTDTKKKTSGVKEVGVMQIIPQYLDYCTVQLITTTNDDRVNSDMDTFDNSVLDYIKKGYVLIGTSKPVFMKGEQPSYDRLYVKQTVALPNPEYSK